MQRGAGNPDVVFRAVIRAGDGGPKSYTPRRMQICCGRRISQIGEQTARVAFMMAMWHWAVHCRLERAVNSS